MKTRRSIPAWSFGPLVVTAWLLAMGVAAAAEVGPDGHPKVDLNRASVAELVRLPGIGPKRAQAILALRKRRPFRRTREIRRVRGIGWKTYRRLRPYLTVTRVRSSKQPQRRRRKHRRRPGQRTSHR